MKGRKRRGEDGRGKNKEGEGPKEGRKRGRTEKGRKGLSWEKREWRRK